MIFEDGLFSFSPPLLLAVARRGNTEKNKKKKNNNRKLPLRYYKTLIFLLHIPRSLTRVPSLLLMSLLTQSYVLKVSLRRTVPLQWVVIVFQKRRNFPKICFVFVLWGNFPSLLGRNKEEKMGWSALCIQKFLLFNVLCPLQFTLYSSFFFTNINKLSNNISHIRRTKHTHTIKVVVKYHGLACEW